VQDAIEVTRKVGVEYLWVDALCIVQDCDQDKAREISAMDQIYSNALFTIAAGSASGAQQGFLGSRASQSPAHRIPFRCPDGSFGTMLLRPIFDEPHHVSYLDERAWTFQEEFLSSRLVMYNLRTLRWSCKEGDHLEASYCRESPNNYLARWISSSTADSSGDTWMWATELVSMYSCRKHSVPSDKLTALSAVAKSLAPKFGCSYLAGLWANDLPMQLLWHSGHVRATDENSRPAIYRAPSWSWASIDGLVEVEPQDFHHPMCSIIHSETEPKFSNAPFAEVVGGYMIVEGYLRSGQYSVENDGDYDIASIRWEEDDVHQQDDVTTPAEDPVTDGLWWMHLDTLQEHTRGHAHFLVIMGHYDEAVEDSFPSLRTCTGLVLKQLSAHTYQRIGIFDTRPGFDSDIGNPPVRQVTII
jgi:hypothetical protein